MAKLKQRPDGYYCAWYKGKQFLGRSEQEARQKRDDFKYECEHGIEQITPATVYGLCSEWLPVAKAGASKTTYNQYVTIMEKLTATIGDKLVSAVSPADIKRVWLSFVGLSQSYISKASFLYKSFFQFALENGYCRYNPVLSDSAKPHSGTKGTHRELTKEEIHLIETVPHRVQPAAMIMLKEGLRRGEVLALQASDIYDGRIHIDKAVKFVKNRPVIGQTKNYSSKRTVPVFRSILPFIDGITGYILPDASGDVCSETAFQRAWESYLHALSIAAGHPVSFRTHDLRHTFTTTCRNKGVEINTVRSWLGHSSERMILQIYDHVNEDRENRMISIMDA